jgi:hypothetical protein
MGEPVDEGGAVDLILRLEENLVQEPRTQVIEGVTLEFTKIGGISIATNRRRQNEPAGIPK